MRTVKRNKKRLKVGLAMGGGAALGLAHIGVLKVLEEKGLKPDYIAGTSMGSVIGAMYASGKSAKEIEEDAKTTNWKEIVDFTVPKAGIIQGDLIEKKIRKLVANKKFNLLKIPLNVVAYNLDKHQKVVFSKGDVARAVRASISVPGVFTPPKINGDRHIDGGVIDPTPFDVVRDMGAEVVVAVDLFSGEESSVSGPSVKEQSLFSQLKEKFVIEELLNIKNYIFPTRWPRFIQKLLRWLFDKLLYPAKILKMVTGRELPEVAKIMNETYGVLTVNLAKERMEHSNVEIKVMPTFGELGPADFSCVDELVGVGEKAMKKKTRKLKSMS